MFYMLGNDSTCPVPTKSVVIQDEVLTISDLPLDIANLASVRIYSSSFYFSFIIRKQCVPCIVTKRSTSEPFTAVGFKLANSVGIFPIMKLAIIFKIGVTIPCIYFAVIACILICR